jgi:hypothetical protein
MSTRRGRSGDWPLLPGVCIRGTNGELGLIFSAPDFIGVRRGKPVLYGLPLEEGLEEGLEEAAASLSCASCRKFGITIVKPPVVSSSEAILATLSRNLDSAPMCLLVLVTGAARAEEVLSRALDKGTTIVRLSSLEGVEGVLFMRVCCFGDGFETVSALAFPRIAGVRVGPPTRAGVRPTTAVRELVDAAAAFTVLPVLDGLVCGLAVGVTCLAGPPFLAA